MPYMHMACCTKAMRTLWSAADEALCLFHATPIAMLQAARPVIARRVVSTRAVSIGINGRGKRYAVPASKGVDLTGHCINCSRKMPAIRAWAYRGFAALALPKTCTGS